MKKIGILTLYYNNYNMGGLLQAYALQEVISKMDVNVEQISFDFMWHYGAQNGIRALLRKIKHLLLRNNYDFPKRIKNFDVFMRSIPHSHRIFDMYKGLKEYDAIITGSDQVWAGWLPDSALSAYMLDYSKMSVKRFSYAASIGMDIIPDSLKEKYKKCLPNFQNISVREASARLALLDIIPEADISVNIDPTLLIESDKWLDVANIPNINEKYIFCYFLSKDVKYRIIAKKIANRFNLKIVTIPYAKEHKIGEYDNDFGDIRDLKGGPKEFLGWIKNSELVLTDSFHAIAFACQFNINFYVLSRISETSNNMNNRMIDFLQAYRLFDRYVSIEYLNKLQQLDDVDFSVFENKIKVERVESRKYIELMLNEIH